MERPLLKGSSPETKRVKIGKKIVRLIAHPSFWGI
jgi:hypothetical protein